MSRILPVTKRVGGKIKRYKNLAAFNRECPSRGYGGNLCTVTNIRCTKRGEGLATVYTARLGRTQQRPGTWLLHFADCGVMKRHLKGRVGTTRDGMLSGSRRRRSRR